jgi:transposase
MWTEITRPKYERAGRRHASDLTDAEWRLIEPYMPAVKRLGRPRETDLRAIVDAILYIARTGCQWRPAAEGLSAVHHGARLFSRLAGPRLVRADQF